MKQRTGRAKGPKDSAGLMAVYEALYVRFGAQGWWPGNTRFEVIVGAILTQNTAWTNVEKAIRNLKKARLLSPKPMYHAPIDDIAQCIRPAGYFNVKAKRLNNFVSRLFERHDGSISRLLSGRDSLRDELLDINGIGPETADSIMLYAGGHPEFVVDAYTKRILSRHGLVKSDVTYDELKSVFMRALPRQRQLYNEYHALIVRTGKELCRPQDPLCGQCPLNGWQS